MVAFSSGTKSASERFRRDQSTSTSAGLIRSDVRKTAPLIQCSKPESEWNSDRLCTSPSGMTSCIMRASASPGPSSTDFGNASGPARLMHAAHSTVCSIWRANLSAPDCTSNTVSPSIPLNSRTPAGTSRRQGRVEKCLAKFFACFGQQRRVRWYRDRQHRRVLRTRSPSILSYSIKSLPCAPDQHLVFSVDDRDISSMRLADRIQLVPRKTADGH